MDCSGPRLALVVAAAGYGARLGSEVPKQYVPLLGIPMLQRTLAALSTCDRVDALAVVVNPQDVDYCREEIRMESIEKVVRVVAGGEERAMSVRNGLWALSVIGTWDFVGVHDGARPLVTCQEIGRAVDSLVNVPTLDGVVLAVRSPDTVKIVDKAGLITSTPDRRTLWRAQTPQIFRWQVLMDAYAQPDGVLVGATDDSALVERLGGKVAVVEGSTENFKITDRADLRHAEQILAERRR
ncbi:MAG: 2-C-methyl-D-erythritol 4-phosphate cytidylyltransferase [Actinobacteria bacterium RBG_16_64_13]|nr:MAG: 2-C-methyl-D-erythritol 4-phosphate cytidylyltransferase [Actinobacteria bacterium RBG_16_64_13]